MLRLVFVLVASLFSSMLLPAQEFTVTTLPTQELLPGAAIHCIFQDSEGFMWYGSGSGLCRDNGYQIDLFRPSPVNSYSVNCIAEDARGNILFGTSDGLFKIDKSNYQSDKVELDSAAHRIDALFKDSAGHLWVGTEGRVYELDEIGDFVNSYTCQVSGSPVGVASFYQDADEKLYVLQWGRGILRKRKHENSFTSLNWPLEAIPLQLIEDRLHHFFWVLTRGEGVQRMTIEGELCKLVAQPSTMIVDDQRRALNMLLDVRSGLLWSTTRDNLYAYKIYSEGFLQEYPLTGIVPSGKKILDQMCQDRDGNIYVSGFTPHTFIISGANKDIVRITADAIQRSEGYPLLADRSVHDGYNHIWIWQGRQGLMLYDRVQDLAEVAPIRCERDIQASSLGGIWAFNGAHVYRLLQIDGAIQQEEFINFHDGEHVRCVFEKAGEALYVAVDSTLYRQTLIGRQQTKVADLPSSPLEFTVTDGGTVYLAMGPDGVYCVHPGGDVKRISDVSESFLSVCAMSDGTVWMSTNEGRVYFYNPLDGQFSMEPLLSSPNRAAIRCVRTDGLGHLWTLTDQLVCEYSPKSRAFRTFRSNDPFINVSYFYALEPIDASSICLDGAGALIDVQSSPELSLQKASQVRPRLTCVRVGNERRLVGRDAELLELAAGEEDFSLELSTLDHLHASSISFAYQLEDIHNKWIYLPQAIIPYL